MSSRRRDLDYAEYTAVALEHFKTAVFSADTMLHKLTFGNAQAAGLLRDAGFQCWAQRRRLLISDRFDLGQ